MKIKSCPFLFAGIITVTSPSIFASGIQVVDVTAIAKTVEEGLNHAAEVARQRATQATIWTDHKDTLKNRRKDSKASLISAMALIAHPAIWRILSLSTITNSAKSDLSSLRSQYDLSSNVAETQQNMMQSPAKSNSMKTSTMKCRKRAKRLTTLQKEFASADTPQKADSI